MRPFYYKSNNEFCVLGSLDSGSSTCPNARQAYGGPNKQTISKLLALRKAENNGYPQVVAKRKLDTGQSNSNGRKKRSRDRARVMAMFNNYPQNRLVRGTIFSLFLSLYFKLIA